MRRFSNVLGDAQTEGTDAAPGGTPLVPTVPKEPPPGRSGRPWAKASVPVRGTSELPESRTVAPTVEESELGELIAAVGAGAPDAEALNADGGWYV